MLQPEEIRNFRKRYGLTQKELSDFLGWGGATLSRYENGALQDETHEKTLRLAMEPRNLLGLLQATPEALSGERRNSLLRALRAAEEEAYSFHRLYEERFGEYNADEFSGYRKLDLAKLFNAILFLSRGGIQKTKLNKVLFYADFKHFKDYGVSITGVRYARITYGPVPDKWNFYFASLIEEEAIVVEEKIYAEDVVGEIFTSAREPNLAIFTDSEIKVLASLKEYFLGFSAKKITEFSHQEKGVKETLAGRLISYEYAEELQI